MTQVVGRETLTKIYIFQEDGSMVTSFSHTEKRLWCFEKQFLYLVLCKLLKVV